MSDDVSQGGGQKPIRSAEVLAPTPEHLLDPCLCCSAQLTLSSQGLVQQCISDGLVFRPGVNKTIQACFHCCTACGS